jgi:3'5'-cyclic nucleotide phosphodiesterase
MDPQFVDLRAAIYTNKSEYYHFRQLLVNAVMATDIMDKDAGAFRKQRWEKAFSEQAKAEETTTPSSGAASDEPSGGGDGSSSSLDAVNRKATIVIEHLIQASDVAHTMQHWHIYSKWNERLFEEMYRAYRQGRADKDPSESWYAGEIGFFDYYVIPLAKKLKACGVFGVSSDEYLNYAVSNRKEWEAVGRERVETMVAKYAPALPAAAVASAEES